MADLSNEQDGLHALKKEHCALALLRILQREPGYRLNDQVILDWLRVLALVAVIDDIHRCAADLEAKGLIKIEAIDKIQVYILTEEGESIALGRSLVEGVLRPSPECLY